MKIVITKSDADRFGSYVVYPSKKEGCWLWRGGTRKKDNRARFWVDGYTREAAIVSYLVFVGEIEDGMLVLHKCDNPNCVNPEHLYLGTRKDNMNDFLTRVGRKYKGEHSPAHKLTNKDARNVRKMFSGGMKQKDIAFIYKTTQSNISHIVRGKTFTEAL